MTGCHRLVASRARRGEGPERGAHLLGRARGRVRGLRRRAARDEIAEKRGELELGEQRAELLRVRPLPAQALQVERDGQVAADRRELLREPRRLRLARQRLAELLRAADAA